MDWIQTSRSEQRLSWLAQPTLCLGIFFFVVSSGAGCGDDTGRQRPSSPPAAQATTPPLPRLAGELLNTEANFEVIYAVEAETRGAPWIGFAWRQRDGQRRWDLIWGDGLAENVGVLYVQQDFDPASYTLFSEANRACSWGQLPDSNIVDLSCAESTPGSDLVMNTILDHFLADVVSDEGAQMIAGRRADCYGLRQGAREATFCIDAETQAPLLFEGDSVSNRHVRLTATAVTPAAPLGAQLLPVTGALSPGERTIARTELGIPDSLLPQ